MKVQSKGEKYLLYTVLTLLSLALLVFFVWILVKLALTTDWNQSWFSRADYTGNMGDFLSGTVGVLLSFISTLLVVITLWEQRKQFKMAQEEQRQNRFEMTYYNLLAMLGKTRDSVNSILDKQSKVKDLIDYYTLFRSYYQDKNRKIEINEANTDAEIDNKREEMASIYEEFVGDNSCKISYYYRYIYHTLMFVINEYESDIDAVKKISKYLNILQSQLSDEEMTLLFYSSFSKHAQDKDGRLSFFKTLDKYQFFENLNREMLLEASHYKFYPHTKYKFLNRDELKKVKVF